MGRIDYTSAMSNMPFLFDESQRSMLSSVGDVPELTRANLRCGEHVMALGDADDLLLSQTEMLNVGRRTNQRLRVVLLAPEPAALRDTLVDVLQISVESSLASDWVLRSPSDFREAMECENLGVLETFLLDVVLGCATPGCNPLVIIDVAALLPDRSGPWSLSNLESHIHAWSRDLPGVFLCCYERRSFGPLELLTVLDNHQVVMLGARWYLNKEYLPPDPEMGERMLQRRIRSLTEGPASPSPEGGGLPGAGVAGQTLEAMLCICSPNHHVDYANAHFRDYVGFDPIGHSCCQVLRDFGYPLTGGGEQQTDREDVLYWEIFHPRDRRWYHVLCMPAPQEGGEPGRQYLIQDVTEQRMTAVDHEHLVATLHRRNLQLQTAARVSRSIARILDPRELMHRTVELVRESFEFYYVGVFLVDARGENAVLQAGTGEAGNRMLRAGYHLPLSDTSMVVWAIAHSAARIAWDVGRDEVHFSNPYLPETRSEIALPLISRGRCIGAITVQAKAVDAFVEEDLPVLQAIADQLSGAIANARLFEAAQKEITARSEMEGSLLRRNRELTLLNRSGRALIASLDFDQFLSTVLAELQHLLAVECCSVWLLDAEDEHLVCRQASGSCQSTLRGRRLSDAHSLGWWAVHRRRSLVVTDVSRDSQFSGSASTEVGPNIRSFVSVPLWVKQKVVGTLQVVDEAPGRFDVAGLDLLESIAATVTMVIENATLYDQARRDAEAKSLLLREVNHRVKNNLMAIIGLLYAERSHAETSQQPMYEKIIDEMIVRLQGLTAVHGMLSDAQWVPVRLSDLAVHIVQSTLQALPRGEKVTLAISRSAVRVTPTQAHNLALILNELVTNAVRHGLGNRPSARLWIAIEVEDSVVRLEFSDDGPGFADDVLQWRHINVGMELVRNLVQRTMGGEVRLQNRDGAVVTLAFRNEVL